jgi:hypothetical protein
MANQLEIFENKPIRCQEYKLQTFLLPIAIRITPLK